MLSLDKVFNAQTVLKSIIRETKVVRAHGIAPECELYLKPENLQITGSFKVRGSAYKIAMLSEEEKAKGVIACSAGNYAQGVALAATKNGIKSLICLPDTAPISKVEATKGYGADVCLVEEYEKCTRMHVYERAPYAGALVFAAFSSSHQDAIAKGMKYRNKNKLHQWNVPYIPIDPKDIGRTYDADVIRVNSQSGKGGIGYLLEQTFGYNLPAKMREHFSYLCKDISDHAHKELKPDEVLDIFTEHYLNLPGEISVTDFEFERENDVVKINITFLRGGEETELEAEGNGSLSAINNALKAYTGKEYTLQVFTQHSMQGQGSHSVAASYIGLEAEDGQLYWGAGTDTDVIKASTNALLSAFCNMTQGRE